MVDWPHGTIPKVKSPESLADISPNYITCVDPLTP